MGIILFLAIFVLFALAGRAIRRARGEVAFYRFYMVSLIVVCLGDIVMRAFIPALLAGLMGWYSYIKMDNAKAVAKANAAKGSERLPF